MDKNSDLKADVLVLGSGGGLLAALTAAEAGVGQVLLLEKQGVLGGNSRLANGFWACESPPMKRANIISDRDDYFRKAMKYAHCSRVNPRVLRAVIDKSGDTVRWLEEKGVEFEDKSLDNEGPPTGHTPVGRPARMMETLIKRCEEAGIKIMLRTSGKKLLREAGGNISGVVAVKDGEEFEIDAKCIIIATGGFTGNRELLKKYCPDWSEEVYTSNWPHHTGDGLIMARDIGAAIADTVPIFHTGPVTGLGAWGGVAGIVRDPLTIWLNKNGQRFIDEGGYTNWENGNAILMQPEKTAYVVFDESIRQKIEEKERIMKSRINTPEEAPENGFRKNFKAQEDKDLAFSSVSLDNIALWIGAKPKILKETIEEYNAAADNGYDPVFAKETKNLIPLSSPPYYVIKCFVDCGETMGGIKVNENLAVLDTQGNIIPGLYAASVIADGWAGQTYPAPDLGGIALGFALHSGRIAGASAAKYILNQ